MGVGLVMQFGRVQGAFTVVTRTDEFKDQGKQELFGAVSLSMKLQGCRSETDRPTIA